MQQPKKENIQIFLKYIDKLEYNNRPKNRVITEDDLVPFEIVEVINWLKALTLD